MFKLRLTLALVQAPVLVLVLVPVVHVRARSTRNSTLPALQCAQRSDVVVGSKDKHKAAQGSVTSRVTQLQA